MGQFKILKEVNIKFVRPNAEIDNNGLFDFVEDSRDKVDADTTTLTHRNLDGLNKEQSLKQIGPAMGGNALVTLKGTGLDDATLKGTNETMSVMEPIQLPASAKDSAPIMFSAFTRLWKNGILKIGRTFTSERNQEKLRRVASGN